MDRKENIDRLRPKFKPKQPEKPTLFRLTLKPLHEVLAMHPNYTITPNDFALFRLGNGASDISEEMLLDFGKEVHITEDFKRTILGKTYSYDYNWFYELDLQGPRKLDFLDNDENSNPLKKQEGGSHYKKFPIQPVEFIQKNNLNWCQGNIIKYVTRYKDKNGLEDLKKAKHYIDMLIDFEYKYQNKKES